ncbi:MAG TPA: CvpA family protein [Verrucomicrobiae bacterium]|jgi:uncharacterized membrane protein required for colicin V production
MELAALVPSFSGLKVNYVDFIAIVWLIVGLFYGRKRGMTQEILPTIQWLAIVVVAGLFYRPLALTIRQYAHFDSLWANITGYLLLAFGVHLVYLWIKHLVHQKLIGTDMFGRMEYYFGMAAGVIHFGCILIMVFALMNARIITQAELAKTEKAQSDAFSDIRFPTYGSIQQAFLFKSFTGGLIETNLSAVMIASAGPLPPSKSVTLKAQQEQMINEILDARRK